ncbi:MAG: class I SAM-dependent methyltransferase [Vicinamibacterales bacterium]
MTERLEDLLARVEREREDADTLYNTALTALDRACSSMPELPHPPPPYDAQQLAAANASWDILPDGAPAIDRSLKGRLRGLVWRLVGPAFERQRHFNAALVDHLNRNVTAHQETQKAITSTLELLAGELGARVRFQSHLIQFLQRITLYVDTRDRASAGSSLVLNAGLSAVTDEWMKRWESLGARDARLSSRVESVSEALTDLRSTAALAQQTSLSLKREVERVLALPAPPAGHTDAPADTTAAVPADLDAFRYLGFENAFRGTPDEIGLRLASYVPIFEGLQDVLDIGCGRGEFLDLMRQHGVRGRGVDLNQAMVEEARARGLDATQGDALQYLSGLPDATLGGVFASQVVEHLQPEYLAKLLETAGHKTRPGGIIVLETINPTCWVAFFESFIRDLTHVRPLHPDTLQFLLRATGWSDVRIELQSPVPAAARLQEITAAMQSPEVAEVVDVVNQNVQLLNGRLFGYQDYAVIGRR